MAPSKISGLLFILLSVSLPALAEDPAIEKLLQQMTLVEKFGQIQQISGDFSTGGTAAPDEKKRAADLRAGKIGSILNVSNLQRITDLQRVAVEETRLKIPLIFGLDIIHGCFTTFVIPLGKAAAWDPASCEKTAAAAADEAGELGVRWTFAPMVDIARDPRWGRVAEGAGEDPYLGSAIAAAKVRGFQHSGKFAACAKHWVAYGAAEAGRDYNTVDLSERTLREVYFPPFRAAVDAGVLTLMSAFNEVDGIPATANHFTLTDVLRGEWHFGGFVVSDFDAVDELMHHGIAGDGAEAAVQALLAGCDMEMSSTNIATNGPALVAAGKIPIAAVDEAVRRILTVKKALGLFENPYAIPARVDRAANRSLARQTAARSIVLLKNEGPILPLAKSVPSIAVVGPLGDDPSNIFGPWAGMANAGNSVTLLAGLEQKFPKAEITYVRGCDITGDAAIDEAAVLKAVQKADVTILAVGESAEMSGEAHSRSNIDLPGRQTELVQLVDRCKKPYVVTLFNGRPLTLGWIADHSPAILETWFGGSEAGDAIADVLSGDVNPSGKLPITFPRNVGQIPLYYAHKNTGRPTYLRPTYVSNYMDVSNDPQYPFGFGLSYTTFHISQPAVSQKTIAPDGTVMVKAMVENTGVRAGDEVVQLYVRDKVSSVTRPVRELKGFQRVSLNPGEKKEVQFSLGPKELGFYDREMKWVVEPGVFDVFVGNSSRADASVRFEVKGG
jgi:beta-glucosidase